MNKQEERVVNCKWLLLNHYFLVIAYSSWYWAKVDSLNKIHAVTSDQISSVIAGYIADSTYKPANMTVQTDLVSISNEIETPHIVALLADRIGMHPTWRNIANVFRTDFNVSASSLVLSV
ncbi:hypothetical protein GYMLUDRAFT_251824 [Collybiopsis luxurians FD-317 M1]|uniref:Uncharacterized protein n=1 Tax=Collybiopsis luxurians FD-317 M1 TaxID=944289 RepID=A0A0D0C1N4_9AGAR|nr:hypothetical protein GYMLUDRAFT_251824 [Collybiopsis luxurians FD-317 M1]